MSSEDLKVMKKIIKLEALKTVCTVITILVGIVTVVDIFVPDPILLLDEAAVASITGLFTMLTSSIDNKIKDLRNGNKLRVSKEEITELTSAVGSTANEVKRSRKK